MEGYESEVLQNDKSDSKDENSLDTIKKNSRKMNIKIKNIHTCWWRHNIVSGMISLKVDTTSSSMLEVVANNRKYKMRVKESESAK